MRSRGLVTLTSLLALALAGCAAAVRPSGPQTLAVSGPTLGRYELKPSLCIAGQHDVFWGADLVEESTGAIARLVVDPITGPAVRVFKADDPFGPSILLRRTDCKTFEPQLQRTGSWINGIDVVKVALDLDCTTLAGDRVVGKLSADECR